MIDKTFEDGYKNLLKENTLLHAEKKRIADSAARHIQMADEEIKKLHGIINSITDRACEIVRKFGDSHATTVEACLDIRQLAPLQISSNG